MTPEEDKRKKALEALENFIRGMEVVGYRPNIDMETIRQALSPRYLVTREVITDEQFIEEFRNSKLGEVVYRPPPTDERDEVMDEMAQSLKLCAHVFRTNEEFYTVKQDLVLARINAAHAERAEFPLTRYQALKEKK